MLNVGACYKLAWQSFSKWWIPLCLLSGVLVAFEFLPRLAIQARLKSLTETLTALSAALTSQDLETLDAILPDIHAQLFALAQRMLVIGAYAIPIAAFLTIAILACAAMAVKGDTPKPRHRPGVVIYAAATHVVLALVKGLAFAFFILPGVYVYVRLFFVPLVMLEQNTSASEAIQISARMTHGNFWRVLAVVLINATVQVALAFTIVGLIPATGFANTARAAAFHMLRTDIETDDSTLTARTAEPPPIPKGLVTCEQTDA